MFARILVAAGLMAAIAWMQRSSVERRERLRVKTVDLPRWEDEGGAPDPDRRVDTPDDRQVQS